MAVHIQPGAIIANKYRVTQLLGKGGMGVVVAAEQPQLGREVAIKFLHAGADTTVMERFAREARIAATLKSQHTCKVFDVGSLPSGEPYMVFEMLRGQDLQALVRAHGPLRAPGRGGLRAASMRSARRGARARRRASRSQAEQSIHDTAGGSKRVHQGARLRDLEAMVRARPDPTTGPAAARDGRGAQPSDRRGCHSGVAALRLARAGREHAGGRSAKRHMGAWCGTAGALDGTSRLRRRDGRRALLHDPQRRSRADSTAGYTAGIARRHREMHGERSNAALREHRRARAVAATVRQRPVQSVRRALPCDLRARRMATTCGAGRDAAALE